MVPVEVFQKIDAGKNPQIFTRECMERALARNESVRGQLDTLKRFRQVLLADLSKAFPNEMGKYRAWRDAQDNRNAETEPNSAGPTSDTEFNMAANTPTGSYNGKSI
ncbi:UNVERIFIED_CONTAM: hypothetical protein GTU68_051006 [Idotea baltica]|nr:hypothetical protein [Idotea baltica]